MKYKIKPASKLWEKASPHQIEDDQGKIVVMVPQFVDHPGLPDPEAERLLAVIVKALNEEAEAIERRNGALADEELGKRLLEELVRVCQKRSPDRFPLMPMCCKPSRSESGLKFWINTGCRTQLDGWKTHEEIEQFIASGEQLVDQMRK